MDHKLEWVKQVDKVIERKLHLGLSDRVSLSVNCMYKDDTATILIYYNTAVRGLTDIYALSLGRVYAQLPRARSTRGRVRIYQSNPEQSCVITFMLHFA